MAVYTTIYSTTNLTVRHIFGQFSPFGIRRWLFRLLKSLILRHKKQKNMKHFYILRLVLFSFIIFTGCQRPETEPSSLKNTLIPISSTAKTTSSYLISAQIGHDGSKCPGCVLENGKYIHVNCQGDGTCCSIAAAVNLQQTGMTFTATTTDTFDLTSEDFFLMPDRSLNYTDEKGNRIFLNIPAQLVYHDSTTRQFTFTGLSFSEKAAYNNN